jgi:hypothetical protein
MSDDQTDGRAIPPTDCSAPRRRSNTRPPCGLCQPRPLKGSLKQPLDDYVYPDQRPPRYPLERDRYVIVCVDARGELYLASRTAYAKRVHAERLMSLYAPSRKPVIVRGAFKELVVQDVED